MPEQTVGTRVGIAAVERDTGLGKDTLRVWERRYGFPTPLRDDRGERVYSTSQVERLLMVKRLMDAGYRPGAVVPLSTAELNALPPMPTRRQRVSPSNAPDQSAVSDDVTGPWMALLRQHQAGLLGDALTDAVTRLGPGRLCDPSCCPVERGSGLCLGGG